MALGFLLVMQGQIIFGRRNAELVSCHITGGIMQPNMIFNVGIGICIVSTVLLIVFFIVFKLYKNKLEKKLDLDYGKS